MTNKINNFDENSSRSCCYSINAVDILTRPCKHDRFRVHILLFNRTFSVGSKHKTMPINISRKNDKNDSESVDFIRDQKTPSLVENTRNSLGRRASKKTLNKTTYLLLGRCSKSNNTYETVL